MLISVHVHGTCDSAFGRVREAFTENFRRFDEVGASLAVVVDGKPVVDLWGGYADAALSRAWERDKAEIPVRWLLSHQAGIGTG